ncbi:MAG: hypothetical protein J1F35_05785 [Erysipelotrichales bacterium]|nr:hypothetical protein [Erysipelotrichales bacterium]
MNPILKDIYNSILEECVYSAEMGLITESPFKYTNCLGDIIINIIGEIYGDGLSFQRGKLTSVEIKSDIHRLTPEDIKEFSEKITEDFYRIINKI